MPSKNQLDDVEIVDRTDAELPQVGAKWSDTVDLSADELTFPFLTLAQAMNPRVADGQAKMGQWLVEGYEPLDSVTFVPLKFGVSRRLSILVNNEQVTKCYAATGTGHGVGNPGIPCEDCEFSKWQPTDKITPEGRSINDPPPCKESFDFMGWSMEHGMLVRTGFKSTGMKTGRLLATLGKTKGLGNFAVKLGSVKATGAKFTFVTPTATILTGDAAEEAVGMGQTMLAIG